MKIHIKYPVVAFCAAMLAAGCSQGETVPAHEDGDDIRVPLVITTADIQTEETGTRASSELAMGTSIGVFLSNAPGSNSYVPQNNVRYNHMGTGWKPATGGIYLKESDANLCAYTPYDVSVRDADRVSLTPRILVENEMPLAYATNVTANEVDKEVRFSMKQACSWVVLSFKRNSIIDDITLSGFSFINAGLSKEQVLNISTGVTESNTAADDGTLTFSGDIPLAKNSTVVRNIALPPAATLSGGLKVSVKIKEYGDKVLSTTLAGLTQLARGYKYAVTLTVDGTNLGVASVEVMPWTETTVNDGGDPFVPMPDTNPVAGIQLSASDINLTGNGCSAQDKEDLAKLKWAAGNLRQQGDDGSGSTIMTSSQSAYGHYYTWNSSFTGNTTSNGTDPCSELGASTYGSGWRTPSKNELAKLSRCTDKQLVVYNSVKGMWFMNNTKGLFLPAAGYRGSNVGSGTTPTVGVVGTNGFYWSNDASNSSYAFLLNFSSGFAYVSTNDKTSGVSVRCVQGTKQ